MTFKSFLALVISTIIAVPLILFMLPSEYRLAAFILLVLVVIIVCIATSMRYDKNVREEAAASALIKITAKKAKESTDKSYKELKNLIEQFQISENDEIYPAINTLMSNLKTLREDKDKADVAIFLNKYLPIVNEGLKTATPGTKSFNDVINTFNEIVDTFMNSRSEQNNDNTEISAEVLKSFAERDGYYTRVKM